MTATAASAAASSVALLDEAGARALTARIRTHLEHLDTLLLTAWRGRVWTALGHDTWDAWVAAELGTVRLRLPVEQRRAVAAAWRREGMSQRAIAAGLGVSKGTVAADLSNTPDGPALAVVISLDGRRRPAIPSGVGPPAAATPASKQVSALGYVASCGENGVTVPELMKKMKWTWSQASACLSRLNRALDDDGRRPIERLKLRRKGHAVYVTALRVSGRGVLAPGERLSRTSRIEPA